MPCADRIATFQPAGRGEVIVRKVARGYSLFNAGTGAPIARLRPTGEADMVQVLWWNGEGRGASGPFGIATMPLDKALDHIATEPAFGSMSDGKPVNPKWPYSS